MKDRQYDIVLFGATGFTGRLTAQYLASKAPAGLKWALAGRNQTKLEAVRDELGLSVDLVLADVTDEASLAKMAGSTGAVITTVGPYIRYGEGLVAACADAGTDYLDLTGEPEFVDTMYVRYHQRAVETGARIVHCCGFDSIPYDLGVQYAVEQLPENVPIKVTGVVTAGGRPSAGTLQTAITIASRAKQGVAAHRERRKVEPRPEGRSVKAVPGRIHRRGGWWAVPLPTVDPLVVIASARALERYGPEFRYSHFGAVKRLPVLAGLFVGGSGVLLGAQIPAVRKLMLDRIVSGDGPSAERRAKSWFKARFIAEGGGKRVTTEFAGGDPGYDETAKMLAECALCLTYDELPETSGQVTTAVAMGPALRKRLIDAGLTIRVVSTEDY
ncbi:saccharopine dehydrogenase NADP-binding domain-containing protein [Kribbella sp. NBC_01245]|uniref:saccharopine dehydrogenase family protein n=1 Tax=Kribbella sp. NBC_01245 TaxID=2903578 RepID=UPI002E2A85EB|nr:saccharopine dehydrogenase NADP-binding domain-containing protein [Kribbella sp. NBC_01245]